MEKEKFEQAYELTKSIELLMDLIDMINENTPYTLPKEAKTIVEIFGKECVIERLDEKLTSLQREFDEL